MNMCIILFCIVLASATVMGQIPNWVPGNPIPRGQGPGIPGLGVPGPWAPGSGVPGQGFSEAWKSQLIKSIDECKTQYNVDQSTTWDKLEGDQKCFFKCVGEKEGMIDENGAILKDKVKQRLNQRVMADPVLSAAIIKCLDETREEACETAEAVANCIRGSVRRFRKPPGLPGVPSIGKK